MRSILGLVKHSATGHKKAKIFFNFPSFVFFFFLLFGTIFFTYGSPKPLSKLLCYEVLSVFFFSNIASIFFFFYLLITKFMLVWHKVSSMEHSVTAKLTTAVMICETNLLSNQACARSCMCVCVRARVRDLRWWAEILLARPTPQNMFK